jgi:hypothetical protein
MYDGTWHAMSAGAVGAITRSIASDGTNVYIGSDAVDIAGIARADHVAKWNGTAWSALGANGANTDGWLPASTFINGIATSGSNVFVAGSFQNARFRVGPGSTAIAAKAPRGTSFKFTLKAPAKVTIALCAGASGRPKRCTRARNVGTLTRSKLQAGRNTIRFSGRIGKRALRPGAYRATLTARNAKGTSKPVAVKFTVVR